MLNVLIVNLAIIAVVIVGLALTVNPLCILALFFLRDMTMHVHPSMFAAMQQPEDEEQPMGFTAHLK